MTFTIKQDTFDSLEEEWWQLLHRSSFDSIFLTPTWLRTWWQVFGEGSRLQLLAVRDRGQLLAVAPLMQHGHTLSLLGGEDVCDYRDFIVARGTEEAVYPALWLHLASLDWQALELPSLPDSSPTVTWLPAMAREGGYQVARAIGEVCPQIALPGSWDDYLLLLSKKDRHELRRKLRRLYSSGNVQHYSLSNSQDLLPGVQDFLRLMRESREYKADFMTPQREQFFQHIAQALSGQGQFRLFFLEVDGIRVASSMCFDYGDGYSLYNSGFDPAYSHISAGLLLKALCIKDAVENGKKTFDFLRGAESYKYDLGGKDVPIYNLTITRGR